MKDRETLKNIKWQKQVDTGKGGKLWHRRLPKRL